MINFQKEHFKERELHSLQELMGTEIYNLIYIHYDENGEYIDDYEDVLLCEDSDIDESRIEPLIKILVHYYSYSKREVAFV